MMAILVLFLMIVGIELIYNDKFVILKLIGTMYIMGGIIFLGYVIKGMLKSQIFANLFGTLSINKFLGFRKETKIGELVIKTVGTSQGGLTVGSTRKGNGAPFPLFGATINSVMD